MRLNQFVEASESALGSQATFGSLLVLLFPFGSAGGLGVAPGLGELRASA